jgi:molybdopterin-guanine dinucleotide biosynthesis protein A
MDEGGRAARDFLTRCTCRYVQAKGDELSAFVNVNTPDDLKRIESHANKIKGMA